MTVKTHSSNLLRHLTLKVNNQLSEEKTYEMFINDISTHMGIVEVIPDWLTVHSSMM